MLFFQAYNSLSLSLSLSLSILYVAVGLRYRSPENKAVIVSEVEKNVWPAIVASKVKPVIYKYFPLSDAAEAHQLMENSGYIGKILLVPQFSGWSCGSDGWWYGFKTLCIYFVAMILCVIVLYLGNKAKLRLYLFWLQIISGNAFS